MEDLLLDIQELDSFLTNSKRPVVIDLLKTKKKQLEAQLALLTQKPKQIEKQQEESKQVQDNDPTVYKAITKYSFEQEGKKIKLAINNITNIIQKKYQDGIGQVEKENIIVKFDKHSFDLKIRGYQNQNLRLSIKKLCEQIDPNASSYSQKKNSIILTLTANDSKTWAQLQFKESLVNPDKLKEKDQDPQASLMNMMKEMYNSGDDEMKKTIAKAWTESQSGKGKQPGFDGL